jgi:hypothetical protein
MEWILGRGGCRAGCKRRAFPLDIACAMLEAQTIPKFPVPRVPPRWNFSNNERWMPVASTGSQRCKSFIFINYSFDASSSTEHI